MKVKARKLLSLVLSLAMVMGMFVLPASAAVGDKHTLEATGPDLTVDSFFTFNTSLASDFGAIADANTKTTWGDGYRGTITSGEKNYYIKFGGSTKYGSDNSPFTASSNAGRCVLFTTTGPVSVKVWVKGGQTSAQLKKATGTNGEGLGSATAITATSTEGNIYAWSLTEAGTYGLVAGGPLQFAKLEVEEVDPSAVSVKLGKSKANTATGATTEVTATVTNGSDATVTWSSSDESIATVTGDAEKATVTGVAPGTATITLKVSKGGTDYTDTCEVTVVPAQDAVLHIFDDSATLPTPPQGSKIKVGKGKSATAADNGYVLDANDAGIGTQEGGSFKGTTLTKLAKFNSNGRIFKFVAPGNGTLKVYFGTETESNAKVNCSVDGGAATGEETVSDAAPYTVTTVAGSAYTIARARNKSFPTYIIWTASDWATKHASHDFTVEAEDGTLYCSNPACLETQTVDPVESIAMTHGYTGEGDHSAARGHDIYLGGTGGQGNKDNFASTTLKYPGSWKMDATVTPATANQGITWSVEGTEDAECPIEVDDEGVVTAVAGKLGTGVVIAHADGDPDKVAYCDVTVLPYITGVTIDQTSPSVTVGDDTELQLTATLALAGDVTVSQLEDEQKEIAWSVDDNTILTVSDDGVVTPLKAGTATVTATAKALGHRADAKTATVEVTVIAADESGLTVALTTPGNVTVIGEGGSLVITATAKLDGEETSGVTYQWQKDGADINGETNATLTVTAAGRYTCTVTSGDKTASKSITITAALQSISAALKAAVEGATYTAGTPNTLVINGKKTVVFDVTTTPAAHDDTLKADLEIVEGAQLVSYTYSATDKTLTVTPLRASADENTPRTLTLKGTKNPEAKWEVKITVKKLPAPATLAKADVTTAAPTSLNGKGTITIANAVAGTTYRYQVKGGDSWTDVEATGTTVTISVNPGTYLVRQKVDAVFQNVPGSLEVVVGKYNAPSHNITVANNISDGSITAEPEDSAPEGSTVEVTVTPDDGYRLLKLWYVKAGETAENAITKTSGVYSFTMPEKDVTIYATFEEGEPEPDEPTDVSSADFDAAKLTNANDAQVTAADFQAPFGYTGTVEAKRNSDGSVVTSIDINKGDGSAFVITIPEGKTGDLSAKLCSTGSSKTSNFALKNAATNTDIAEDANKSTASGGTGTAATFTWTGLKAGTYHIYCPSGSSNLRVVTAHVDFKTEGTVTPPVVDPEKPVSVTGVSLNTNALELVPTEEATLIATVAPANAADKTVTWTSSDASKVTVDATGKVTAVAVGTAKITVTTTDGSKTAECTVTVIDTGSSGPTTSAHTFESKTLTKNTTAGANGTEAYAGDNYFTVMPGSKGKYDESSKEWKTEIFGENAYDPSGDHAASKVIRFSMGSATKGEGPAIKFTTTSDNAKVQIWWVQGGGDTEGKNDDGTKNGIFSDVGIRQIALLKTDATVVAKSELAHTNNTPSGTDAGRIKANDPEYTELTAPTAGAYMVGSLDGSNYIFKIVVTETTTTSGGVVSVTGVTLDKTTASIAVGKTEKLTATIAPADATNKKLTWSTSDPAVATVAADGTVTAVKAGTATITVTTANGKTATCAVTVTASQGGSSSSGGGSSMVPTTSGSGNTVTNPDGSKTTTKTNSSTGAVTETTTYPDGSKTVVVTETDGTKTETITKKDGTKTETVTKPDGSSTVAATDAKGIKTEVATSASGEVSAKVSLPKSVDKTIVTIPAKDVTDGTVAVIVNANGTEQIIKTSMAGENGLELLVDKNVSVKIKDNAKKFDDIADDYWAKGAVDFVSSREIFKGVYETVFAPADEVNRGMMATVLYRLADAKAEGENVFFDVADGTWYTDAVTWANRSGVVTGYADGNFGPADAVTREQMAAMLFRFAKVAGMDITAKGDMSKFSDANDVSSWASEAMAWAVGVGIINGVGDPVQGTILAPAKSASRAEVATIMQRMVKLMMQ